VKAILETLTCPQELRILSHKQLKHLAQELRTRIMDVVSITGGHLSSNLGIIELTIALHVAFNSPEDKFIFDVGHQSYTHKLLTGRNPQFETLRQEGGICGFTYPPESPHDLFYSGHAGNALSLALGMAKNRDLKKQNYAILPIIGDAALTCGLTLEAMNNIPKKLKKFLIVLNDNAMSISKNVGAITRILSRFLNNPRANNIYKELTRIISKIPGYGAMLAIQGNKIKESLKNLVSTAPFFEQFGLSYIGPIDGHDIKKLIDTFKALKDVNHPTIVHVLTVKGQGMQNAINHPTPYHAAKPFNRITGNFYPSKSNHVTFPQIFGHHLLNMAEKDPHLVAITPAMPAGSCLEAFMKRFPERCIDVGIAEGHSLTYAGGLGMDGKCKVVVCVYSSFLQRAFDNIYHDVCVQRSPIVIAIDRGGLAAGDGLTAQGIYDIGFLHSIPHMIIAQPRNGHVLKELLESAFDWNRPSAIRYPNLETSAENAPLKKRKLGKGELLAEGEDVLIISLGHMYKIALHVRNLLLEHHIHACVIDPVFIKPLDEELLIEKLCNFTYVITIEEHAIQGGLGSIINTLIVQKGFTHLKVKNFGIPDEFVKHGSYKHLLKKFGITATAIADEILQKLSESLMMQS